MLILLQRIIRLGFEKIKRDRGTAGAALFAMISAIAMATFLFFLQGVSTHLVEALRNAADISTYFTEEAAEEDILQIRDQLLTFPEVTRVEYVSKDQALAQFQELHKNDPVILESLEALGQNPLLASLNITAQNPAEYRRIAEFLQQESLAPFIENVDYREREPIIGRLTRLASGIQFGVLLVSIGLAIIAVFMIFNTVRLTILNSKEEIEIMRLVGASNWFIQGPFVVEGVVIGFLSALIMFLLLIPVAAFLGGRMEGFLSGFHIFNFFTSNIFSLLLLQLGVGVGLGVVSSIVAVRRYLNV